MIRSTFLHLPGVGPITEAELWRRGVRDWAEFGELPEASALASARGDRVRVELAASERALAERHVEYFASRLPSAEHWRLYPAFGRRPRSSTSRRPASAPTRGSSRSSPSTAPRYRTFVADEDLEELPAYLRKFRLLSTFNGRLFDVPFLAHRFRASPFPPSTSTSGSLYRLGYGGGLKRIRADARRRRPLRRRRDPRPRCGPAREAFRRGDTDSLARLVRYNRADTVNLEPLLEFAVNGSPSGCSRLRRRPSAAEEGPARAGLRSRGSPCRRPGARRGGESSSTADGDGMLGAPATGVASAIRSRARRQYSDEASTEM